MRNIPMPPGFKPKEETEQEFTQKLTEDETAYIIRTTLYPHHRTDPNVLGFISNYMICRDAKQAAKELGLHWTAGIKLLRKVDIHDCISKLTQKMVMKHGFDGSEIVERVKEVAGIDVADIFNEDGTFKKIHEIAPEVRRAFKKFKVKNSWSTVPNGQKIIDGEILEVEFWDKLKAVELLGREKDLFKEKKVMEHDIGKNMSSILLESSKRAVERIGAMRDVTQPAQITSNTEEDDE